MTYVIARLGIIILNEIRIHIISSLFKYNVYDDAAKLMSTIVLRAYLPLYRPIVFPLRYHIL